jgi:hypothetical protein
MLRNIDIEIVRFFMNESQTTEKDGQKYYELFVTFLGFDSP